MQKLFSVIITLAFMLNGCSAPWRHTLEECGPKQEQVAPTQQSKTERQLALEIYPDQTESYQNAFSTPITKSELTNTYRMNIIQTLAECKEYRYQSRVDREAAFVKSWTVGSGALGALLGLSLAVVINAAKKEKDYYDFEDRELKYDQLGTGTTIALVIGSGAICAAIGYLTSKGTVNGKPSRFEPRKQYTGIAKDSIFSTTHRWDKYDSRKDGFESPAINIPVIVESEQLVFWNDGGQKLNRITVHTDSLGRANVRVAETPDNWAFTKEALRKKAQEWETLSYVKETARDQVFAFLTDEMYPQQMRVYLKTDVQPAYQYTDVENDEAKVYIPGQELHPDAAFTACQLFIDEEINSHMKLATIKLKNLESHASIGQCNLESNINAPSIETMVAKYFKGPLVEWAQGQVDSYVNGEFNTMSDDDGVVTINIYTPCTMEVEITHPKYNFAKQSISFTDESLTKTIYMPELGTKTRVKMVDR